MKLNLSQKAIAESEAVAGGSAINTISLKIHFPDRSAEDVKRAADAVLRSADVFAARLIKEKGEWEFYAADDALVPCRILNEMTGPEAEAYAGRQDRLSLAFPDVLYECEAIPLTEGGCLFYARFHHILTDGYGMTVFQQRLFDVLAGEAPVPSRFLTEQAAAEDSDETFWTEYFSDADFSPEIFTETADGTAMSVFHGQMGEELVKQVQIYAKANGVTLAYVLASAYLLYLAEATGKQDAVILMPRLNRGATDMDTIGCCTLLVPVRVRIESSEHFSDLCKRVQESARAASAHKRCGYGNILRTLRMENLVNDVPSQYVFNFYRRNSATNIPNRSEMSVAGAMNNHLTFTVFPSDSGLSLRLDLRNGVYDEVRARRFTESFLIILAEGLQDRQIGEIGILGDEEGEKCLVNGEEYPLDGEATIPSLFRNAAERYADMPALYAADVALTFKELDELSDNIASALVSRGVKRGDRVAYMLKRDFRILPTVLGISKAGAAFIPVDPAYPADRVQYIIEDSAAAYLISSRDVPNSEQYCFVEVEELLKGTDAVLPRVKQSDTAYLIYTSGTTGRPKGVMLSHRGIVNITDARNNPFNRAITEGGTGIVAIGSVCFDISLFEWFVPLFNGRFIEFGSEKAMLDAQALADSVLGHGANILHCTPSRIAAYLSNSRFKEALKSVKYILAAGESLPPSLVTILRDEYGIQIFNGYGPTETTIGATITEAGDDKTIGKPIANMGIVLLNPNGKRVPLGAVGEICVFGEGLGQGYHGREDETKEKFIYLEGMRLYRTGDLGRISEDGRLLYLGRCDRQIKLRGLRIELSEIEKVLGCYTGITQAQCIVKKINSAEHLIGFYTVEKGVKVNQEELLAHLRGRLTAYMVPDVLVELDEMPQTPGGKTDMKALQNIHVDTRKEYAPPENFVQRMLCRAFEDALGIERVGIHDNYFELGGDSLGAVELVLSIEEKLGLKEGELDYGDIYKYPTPILLSEKIGARDEVEDEGYDIVSLDYTDFEQILKTKPYSGKRKRLGNVLLTGVTGYLGAHILIELLKTPDISDKIYCLARPKGKLTAERRVRSTLFYYEEEDFSESCGEKWFVVEGDILKKEIFLGSRCAEKIDTVINCAANVAHFAYGDALSGVNVGGVNNLIEFALQEGAELCHVSTISVGGVTKEPVSTRFSEENLFIGQRIYNEYIYTKYMAEHALLTAAAKRGLPVKIMRVGNLQGRNRDGEFQMNLRANAFTRQLSAYIKMKAVPRDVYEASVNFSPIDETARRIVLLLTADCSQTVFHVYPPDEVPYRRLFENLKKVFETEVAVVSPEEFEKLLTSMKRDESQRPLVEGLLTERPNGKYQYLPMEANLTLAVLEELGENWQAADDDYLIKYLTALGSLDMF